MNTPSITTNEEFRNYLMWHCWLGTDLADWVVGQVAQGNGTIESWTNALPANLNELRNYVIQRKEELEEHEAKLLNCFGIIPAAADSADSAPTTCERCGAEIAPTLMTWCRACEEVALVVESIERTGQIPADITITCPNCGLESCTCDTDPLPPAPIDPEEFEEMWATDGPAAHRALAALTPGQLTMQALVFNAYLYGRYGWSESSSVWCERFERAAVWERHQQHKARGLSPTRLVARAISNLPPVAADKADPILEAQRLLFVLSELAGKLYEHIQVYQRRSGFLEDPEYLALVGLSRRVHLLHARANERCNRRRLKALGAMRRASF